jgi:hypothetical protein
MIANDSHVMEDTRRYAAFAALGIAAGVVVNAVPILAEMFSRRSDR